MLNVITVTSQNETPWRHLCKKKINKVDNVTDLMESLWKRIRLVIQKTQILYFSVRVLFFLLTSKLFAFSTID